MTLPSAKSSASFRIPWMLSVVNLDNLIIFCKKIIKNEADTTSFH